MTATPPRDSLPLELVLKALADPTRLEIIRRTACFDEIACTDLERDLGVAKSTISYHIGVLHHADLIDIRKQSRFYFYSLRRDVLESHLPGFADVVAVRRPLQAQPQTQDGVGASPSGSD